MSGVMGAAVRLLLSGGADYVLLDGKRTCINVAETGDPDKFLHVQSCYIVAKVKRGCGNLEIMRTDHFA